MERSFSMKDCLDAIDCEICGNKSEQVINCENGFQLKGGGWAPSGYSGKSNIRWIGKKPND